MENNVLTGKRTIGEIGLETRQIYDYLREMPIGATVKYTTLTSIAGRNVQTEAVGSLQTARRMCQREHQMVFSPIRGEGLTRLDNTQIVAAVEGDIQKIHRTARRGVKKLACVEYQKLDDIGKSSLNAKAAILGTLAQHSTASSIKQLERHYANEAPPVLPLTVKA